MNRWTFAFIAIILSWSALLAPKPGDQVYADAWLDGTPELYEQARFLNQVLGNDDEVRLAP